VANGSIATPFQYEMDVYNETDDEPLVANRDDDIDVEEPEIPSTPITREVGDDSIAIYSQEVATDTELDAPPTALNDDLVLESEPETTINGKPALSTKMKSTKQFRFKKLTPAEKFIEYLTNPEEMSFEEIYYRTSQTSLALQALQEEYENLEVITKEAEIYQKAQIREAKQAAKLLEEAKLLDEQPELIRVLMKYEDKVRQTERAWKIYLLEVQESGLPENDPETYSRLMRLRNDIKLRNSIAEKIKLSAEESLPDPEKNLVDVPLPKLTAEDQRHEKVRKKSYLENPVRFDDRRQMDAYGLPYSAAEVRVGDQILRDRNAVDSNGDSLYENGRPKRSRAKRTMYDTEASEAPSPEEEEVLPAKRRRIPRNPEDADGFVNDGIPRAETPVVKTFPSGIGRPPKSLAKSRLNEAHIPPVMGNQEDQSQSADEDERSKKQRGARSQLLDSSQENDLVESATALVEQTLSDQGMAEGSSKTKSLNGIKSRGRGGRPKKRQETDDNASDAEEPTGKTRGGRAKRKSAARGLSSSFIEDDEILQSTEQDDQSRFASASTSRPTTSSSHATGSSGGSRANSRSRDFAMIGSGMLTAQGSGVSTRGRGGKRKLSGMGYTQDGDGDDTSEEPPKRRRMSAKNRASSTNEDFTEVTGETSAARSKRKRPATIADSIEVVRLEPSEHAAEGYESKLKRKRTMTSKNKVLKDETESDFEEEDGDDITPRKKQKSASRKGKSNGNTFSPNQNGDPDVGEYHESDDDKSSPKPTSKKSRAITKKPKDKKSLARPPKGKGHADNAEEKELDPETLRILEAKRASKSAKLSASAKARWASGLMKGPMEKRARTNAAKAALKKASASSASGAIVSGASTINLTNDGSQVPGQSFTQGSAEQEPSSQSVSDQTSIQSPGQQAQAVMQTIAVPTPIRNSKRPRKPTLKAPLSSMGMDGTAEDDSKEPRSQMSAYDTFQALSSPGSPMILGKRVRKPVMNAQLEEEYDDSDWA
jgi:hypothetical protein